MISKTVIKLSIILTFLCFFLSFGQEKKFAGNPDTAFENARNLAFNQQRKQAQDTLVLVLTKYPDYHDIREFLATTYSWDGEYKKARKEFDYILEKDANRKSTWIAAIKNELWANAPYAALEMTTESLKKFPEEAEILYLKANAQEKTENSIEAYNTIQTVLDKNPEDQKAIEYKKSLNERLRKNSIQFKSSIDLYSEKFSPMFYNSITYSRKTKYGSILGRVNFDRRFNQNGTQYEVDLYPKISKGFYAYLNFGLSNSFLFPDIRYGVELYKSLPNSFEASLGFRGLEYNTTTIIYTGSVGWYKGNNYWSFRPYITPSNSRVSSSGIVTYRKYRSDADNYLGLSFGMGFSPEDNYFNTEINAIQTITLNSQKFKVDYYFSSTNKRNAWGTQFGITHQEKSFNPGSYLWFYSLSVSWDLKFK
ncbi:MAG: YaiO family outer membrane beta-barrel protein [Flavobacterium sp.]|uniref:YaiO family outer membrane beta-barrel protein n=1 Tax=Flavobacterium sp. TaxID=239 RepID=UPI0026236013|nr:YaiO family outer membrane beta-barrel protein [Flavobacterium sp.]MDD5151906.1 YaiO family outer membrane beta-barrel protein [Flavobacterium sp.]